ncbi:import inner membrane translocase, subunit Tim44 [Magnetococcus marinus MC-1]|uniref:Import inner membrane translocase, subunit Tim44 n=1 Tax=Magnetococcus marinus (strain ATCC BAA-1437 / JCM 17883 / MC-1) TaxID=156889 RepID=A0L4W4_MAGMM|nr:Tim44 domain-containing protein [Magnetococcus marinus]ABK43007.1 import inner membrane translocase, subunit Tim44 [Magnetococcus marinus MC-1]
MGQRRGFALVAITLTLMFSTLTVWPEQAEARMGRSSSFGSKGSRSMSTLPQSSPSRFSSTQRPSATQQTANQPQQKSGFGGMLGGLFGGLLLGGLLGSLMGAGGGLGGLLMMVLLAAGVFFLVKRFMGTRPPADEAAYARSHGAYRPQPQEMDQPMQREMHMPQGLPMGSGSDVEDFSAQDERQQTLDRLLAEDSNFDEFTFIDGAKRCFEMLQTSWSTFDMTTLQGLLTPQMMEEVENHARQLQANGQRDVVKNVHFSEAALVEAWSEQGQDYLTVRFDVSLVEYVEDASGQVVSGDANHPQQVQEFWVFTRAQGARNPNWQLSAIQQAQ